MSRPVSLKDVARRAGVSFQTTSKVLNDGGTVAPATRIRILGAAEELGYVPNALARSLITRSTATIGVVASDMSQTLLLQPIVGIEREARRHGHSVLIGSIDREGDTSEAVLRTLLERRVDGIILVAPQAEEDERVAALLRGRTPVVSTHDVAGGGIPVVHTDQHAVGLMVTRHLTSRGHRRIGTIIGARDRHVTRQRLAGYAQALREAGVDPDPALVEEGDWDVDAAYEAGHRLLDRAPDITAIFAQNDIMAIGLLSALYDRGLRVPDQCAVIGCDDIPVAARTIPPLTTVRIPVHETGEVAARVLFDLIAERPLASPEILMPARLVHRASTGEPHQGDAEEPPAGRESPADALERRA